jgi:hypothetical protein
MKRGGEGVGANYSDKKKWASSKVYNLRDNQREEEILEN